MVTKLRTHPKRRSKYNSRITVLDGITFHSANEAKRYAYLKVLEKAGEISNLKLQPKFAITAHGKPIGKRGRNYYADFSYINNKGQTIYEDFKGHDNEVSSLKRDMVEGLYLIKIHVIKQIHAPIPVLKGS